VELGQAGCPEFRARSSGLLAHQNVLVSSGQYNIFGILDRE